MTSTETKKVVVRQPAESAVAELRMWMIVCAVLVVGLMGYLWGSARSEPEEIAARRQQIQNMTDAERERLTANFEAYQQLSDEDKAALREIQSSVETDAELKANLLAYDRWLNSLSPWQRKQLREADSPNERLALISSINDERRARKQEFEQTEKDYQELVKNNLSYQERRSEGVRLSDRELDYMMSILDEEYASQVRLRPKSLPGKAAYNLQLMAVALRDNIDKKGLEVAREYPLPQETLERMIETIADTEVHEQIEKRYEEWGPRGFVGYLSFKLQMAWWNEARWQVPSHTELEEVAKTLGGRVLEKFEERKKEDPKRAYYELLKITRPATFKLDSKNLDDVLDELDIRKSTRRPHRGGPSRGRHDDDDRRGGRDDDDRRGGRDERDGRPNGPPPPDGRPGSGPKPPDDPPQEKPPQKGSDESRS